MAAIRRSLRINAPAAVVWPVLARVTAWPEFLDMIESVEPLDGPNLKPGARFYIHQKGVQETTWTVEEVVPSRAFSWKAYASGTFLTARHALEPDGQDAVVATLEFRMSGALGMAAGLLMKGKAERYMEAELEGIRARAEAKRGAGRAA